MYEKRTQDVSKLARVIPTSAYIYLLFASRSLAIRTVHVNVLVIERANDIDRPASPAKTSSPPRLICPSTATRQAVITINVLY